MTARVDVIIPTFNRATTLPRTLASLHAQTASDWRAIVVDDGSTDGGCADLDACRDSRVTVVRQSNAGVSAARNTGLRLSTAPFICFLDADDTLDPDYIARMTAAAARSSRGAVCGFRYVDPAGVVISDVPPPTAASLTRAGLMTLDPIAIMSAVHRRESLLALPGSPDVFDPALTVFEDWDLLMRLSRESDGDADAWAIEPRTLASYWTTPASLSSRIRCAFETGAMLLRRYAHDTSEATDAVRSWTIRSLAGAVAVAPAEIETLLVETGAVRPKELAAFAAALRWALQRWRIRVDAVTLDQRLRRCVPDPGHRRRVVFGANDDARWTTLFRRAEDSLGPGGRLVLYGMGRNGRAAAAAHGAERDLIFIDDAPDRAVDGASHRITIADLTETDVVVVTPDHATPIVERLRSAGISNVLTLDDAIDAAQTAASP